MKNTLFLIIALVVIGGGWWYYSQTANAPAPGTEVGAVSNGMPVPGTNTDEMLVVREFTVEGSNFSFSPSTMTVKKGETVRITFVNKDGFHDFVLDEFGVKTEQIKGGTQEVVEFVADKAGTFEYYCSVGQHRQMGMKGALSVTE